ncbi:MAG: peptidylprolyl isomerase [Candidatus Spechtbacterales bacterium]
MENKIKLLSISGASAVIIGTILAGVFFLGNKNEQFMPDTKQQDNVLITLQTNKGNIVLELFTPKMPITAGNFIKLAGQGFYDGTKFHRVIEGFMIQGGDPNSKGDDASTYGTGGPGYTIADEFVKGFSNVRGTISMANTGQPNSGGSQFFINLVNNTGLDYDKQPLTSKHPVFGKVVSGMDIVDEIGAVETGLRDVPVESVIIEKVIVHEG